MSMPCSKQTGSLSQGEMLLGQLKPAQHKRSEAYTLFPATASPVPLSVAELCPNPVPVTAFGGN